MTKDEREDAERRMATVKPVTAGIASKAVIQAQSNMTKEDREDAERRLAYAKSVTPIVAQSRMTKDAREAAPDWVKLALQVGAAYLLLA